MRLVSSILLLAFFVTNAWSQNELDASGQKTGYWVVLGKDRPGSNVPADGKIEEGFYLDGRKHGKWIKYYPDGKTPRIQGIYKHNRPDGEFIRYYSNGNPEERGHYYKNNFSGDYWRYYPNGKVSYYNPCGKDDETCDTVYYYRKDGCLSHKDYIFKGTYERLTIVYSKTNCNQILDTVANFEGWAELYDWNADTVESVQKFRLAYPLQKENIREALQKTNGNQLDAGTPYFWQVVAAGKNALPILTELLTETTPSGVKNECLSDQYSVGELAYLAILEIAEMPEVLDEASIDLNKVQNNCGKFSSAWKAKEKRQELGLALQKHFDRHLMTYSYEPLDASPKNSFKKKYGVRGRMTLK